MITTFDYEKQPLVSIVTVVLNGEKEIRGTLESVFSQNYKNIEYIVVDGGSTDCTIDILREYEEDGILWKSEKDTGISDAFNKGIQRANGSIIGIINAGDWYEPHAIENVAAVFSRDDSVDIVCGDVQYWHGDKKAYRCASRPDILDFDMSVTHPSCFIRKSIYERYGMFDTQFRLAMDYELLLRLKCCGGRFFVMNRVLANMRHGGVSEENWKKSLFETHMARRKVLKVSFLASPIYYWFLVVKKSVRRILERLGLEQILKLYREKFALVKKTRS